MPKNHPYPLRTATPRPPENNPHPYPPNIERRRECVREGDFCESRRERVQRLKERKHVKERTKKKRKKHLTDKVIVREFKFIILLLC